jgi:hypothetical protein
MCSTTSVCVYVSGEVESNGRDDLLSLAAALRQVRHLIQYGYHQKTGSR